MRLLASSSSSPAGKGEVQGNADTAGGAVGDEAVDVGLEMAKSTWSIARAWASGWRSDGFMGAVKDIT